jgi:hypothetical protein
MIDGSVPVIISICQSLGHQCGLTTLGSLRRKLRPIIRLVRHGEVSDPSLSMSNSPSPPRTPHHGPASSNSNQQLSSSAASRSSPAPMSTLAIAVTSPASPFYDPVRRPYATDRIHAGHAYHMPAAHHTEQGSRSLAGHPSQYTTSHPIAQSTPQTASQPSTSASNATPSMSSRGGRKSKAHVASACINCKRAHLSCDVSRPCARCVSAGKQVCHHVHAFIALRSLLTPRSGHLRRCTTQKTWSAAASRRG